MKVRIEYADGRHWAVRYEDGQLESVSMTEDEWAAYRSHCVTDRLWQEKLLNLGNSQYEKEHPK